MLKVLEQFGLSARKLALSSLEDSEIIAAQICSFKGSVCEQQHVDFIYSLISKYQTCEPVHKRLRGEHIMDPLVVGSLSFSDSDLKSSSSARIVTSEVAEKTGGKPTNRRHRPLQDHSDARAKKEAHQREKWSRILYQELMSMDAPILKGMDFCVSTERLHLAIAGKTRTSTLRRYIKTWQSWLLWKGSVHGESWSFHPSLLCEYWFSRFDEPCGPSIPTLICKSIHWMEKIAGLPDAEKLSTNKMVQQVTDYIVEQLSLDAPPPRRAPRYPSVVIEKLEAIVVNPLVDTCMRILAWVKLLKIWGSLRYDDLQKINPGELSLSGGRLTTVLRVTKTSGPGRRIQEMPVCISEHAYIWDGTWLATGFGLLKENADFERDYLLPQFENDWRGFRNKFASYGDVTSYSCSLRRAIRSSQTLDSLLPDELLGFWTEHSERATLPTGLAMLGVAKPDRDLVGRWKPDASDSYIRSYNGLVAKLQYKFAGALRKQDRYTILDEVDVLSTAEAWLKARKPEITDEERSQMMESFLDSLREFTGDESEWVDEEIDARGLEEWKEPPDKRPLEDRCLREAAFVVVYNNNRCKRLHKIKGGCWMARTKLFKSAEEFSEMPGEDSYTHVCQICWPESKGKEESSEDTSSTSSSSDDSDSDEPDA